MVKNVLIKPALHTALLGAGALTLSVFAPVATMTALDGTVTQGHEAENGDGTHEFLTDTDGDGLVDTQQRIDDDTGEELSESESLDLEDTIKDVWHMVTGFFSD
ncbi:hypothetical protein FS749_002566 [Ceratobasidium sp. UAMH 11750]|nr:hypothetical protein FS749_002566 [Ceratobasidium sp. UAMH 11750]